MTTEVGTVGAVNPGNQDTMKGLQAKEAADRLNTGGRQDADDAGSTEGVGEDVVVSDAAARTPAEADPQEPSRPSRPLSYNDEQRNSIVANFRRQRDAKQQEEAEDAGEIAEFMRSGGMPKEFQDTFVDEDPTATETQVEAAPEPEPQPEPQPRKFKIKVRGGEREVTEEELVALAQKNEAADDYMNEAKTLLNEVKGIKRDLESRPSPTATPADDRATPEDQPPDAGSQHQADPYQDMTEALLYGDPEKGAAKFRDLITTVVPKIVSETVGRERLKTEHNRSKANVDKFRRENEELARDPMAVGAIEAKLIEHQLNDLVRMGIKADKLPKDPVGIANLHLKFRSDPSTVGLVRTTDELFDAAKSDFVKWKGGTPPQAPANGNGAGATPKQTEIQVSVNRDDRRRIIPQQPSRTAVVRQAQPEAPPPKTRAQVIADMRKARGQV